MENKIIDFNTAKLAKEKGFSMFNKDTKCAIVDTRNYDVQRFSFYIDTTNQDVCRLYDDVIKRAVVFKKNVGTNSSEFNGLIPYYEGKVSANIHYYLAPDQSLLQKWLREKHQLFICVKHKITGSIDEPIVEFTYNGNDGEWNSKYYSTYEQALEIALVECLQRVSETVA